MSDLKGTKLKASEKMHMSFDVCSKHLFACLSRGRFPVEEVLLWSDSQSVSQSVLSYHILSVYNVKNTALYCSGMGAR